MLVSKFSLAIVTVGVAINAANAAWHNKSLLRATTFMSYPLHDITDEMRPSVLLKMPSGRKKLRRI